MFLDWPEQKGELGGEVPRAIRKATMANAPIVSEIPHIIINEGHAVFFISGDERREVTLERHEAKSTLNRDEVLRGGGATLVEAIGDLGASFGQDMDKNLLETLRGASARSGSFFGGKTVEELAEQFFDVLKDTQVDFDQTGKPLIFTVAAPGYAELMAEMDNPSTEYGQKLNQLLEEKHLEWFHREGHRRLAD